MVRLACFVVLLQLSSSQPVPATGSVEGSVVQVGAREPLEDVRVDLIPAELADDLKLSFTPNPTVRTDDQGRFAFKDVAAGKYRLTFSAKGFVKQDYGQRSFVTSGTPIRLSAGQTIKDLAAELTPTGAVSGRISDNDKQPLEGVSVQLMRFTYNDSGERQLQSVGDPVKSDDRGEYRIYTATPGRYYVNASTPPIQNGTLDLRAVRNAVPETYASLYFPGVSDVQLATLVDVLPGATRDGTDFKLSKVSGVRVRGRLIDATTGQPPEKPSVSLAIYGFPGFPSVTGSDRSTYNKDGTFEFRDVLPGWFRLHASIDVPGQPPLSAGRARERSGYVPLEVGSSDIDGLVITLSPGASLSGRVKVEGRNDFAAAAKYVMLTHLLDGGQPLIPEGPDPWDEIKHDGTFRIENVMPGKFSLWMDTIPGMYIKEARSGVTDILNQPFQFTGRETENIEIMLSPNVASLEGVVRDNRLTVAPGVQVVLVPKRFRYHTDLFSTAITDQEGHFSLMNIAPGDYTLYAWEAIEPNRWFDPDFLKADEQFAQSIQLTESSKQTVNLRLIPARTP